MSKVEVLKKKKAYHPIAITLETEREFVAVWNLLNISEHDLKEMIGPNFKGDVRELCSILYKLWNQADDVAKEESINIRGGE